MASFVQYFVFSSLLLALLSSVSLAQQSFRPKALVLPVTKDASTLQYLATINQRTPLVPVKVVVDLGGQFLWVDCDRDYVSSTYRPARCGSAQCSLAKSTSCSECYSAPRPGCNNNTCGLLPGNTVTHVATSGDLGQDVVSVDSTDGSNPGRAVTVSKFLFTCGSTFLLEGLAKGAVGMAGLGRAKIGLPSQFASAFSFNRKFAVCLSSSTSLNGVVFFGNGPYVFLPGIDVSPSLTYTPLLINPVSTAPAFSEGDSSTEYFIGVKSITISDKAVPVNKTLLSINSQGVGGTKISSVDPYTVLENSIFEAVTTAFINEAASMNITRVASVAPFDVCFSSKNILGTRLGAFVPTIGLVLQNQNVVWRIFGTNSMVEVSRDVYCLGFVNGGSNPTTSIVIGLDIDGRAEDRIQRKPFLSELKDLVKETKAVMRIPSFQIIVAQGVSGSFPWSALSFAPMWLELIGFSHEKTALLMALFVVAGSLGGLFGGSMGDILARHLPNSGRIILSQISSGSAIPLAAILLLVLPDDPSTAFMHGLVLLIMGFCISWNGPATNNPIFAEIVPEKSRTSIYALDRSFESILSSFAPPVVGILAQHVYGYKPIPKGSSDSVEIETDRENAASLAKALYTAIGIPMALCCFIYSFLYCTYPRDRERARMHALIETAMQQLDADSSLPGEEYCQLRSSEAKAQNGKERREIELEYGGEESTDLDDNDEKSLLPI